MTFQYTFSDGTVMTGWDPAILSTHQQERIAAYESRWGKSQCPTGSLDAVEKMRCFFWAYNPNTNVGRKSIPKCFGCRNGNLRMPGPGNAPDGSDDEDLLPCGCTFESAMVEMVLARAGFFAPGSAQNFPSDPNVTTRGISSEMKKFLWDVVQVLLGPNATMDDLVSGNSRLATLTAAIAGGLVNP